MTPYFAGIDIGSTMTKVVILGDGILTSIIGPTGPEHRRLANKVMEEALKKVNLKFSEIQYIVSTGYGRINVPFSDRQITEITCHARGITFFFPEARTIIDIGGQDVKGIKIDRSGKVIDFVMNDKCAAGTGRFIEVISDSLGISLEDVGELSLQSNHPAKISNICTIWAQQEIASSLARGTPISDLLAGVHQSLAERIVRMVHRLKVEKEIVVTGGGGKNKGLLWALSNILGEKVLVPKEPLITGALGAALLAKEIAEEAKRSDKVLKTRERRLEKIEIL
ncbi:MAG: acyl-CoA dehydratase activase [Thermodesulfobacteriota bacterium]